MPADGPKGAPQADRWESVNEQFAGTLRAQNLRCKNEYGITLKGRLEENESKEGGLYQSKVGIIYIQSWLFVEARKKENTFSRGSKCVTQQTRLLCHTADMPAV